MKQKRLNPIGQFLKVQIKRMMLLFILFSLSIVVFSQDRDTVKMVSYFSGEINVTNNGISLIPSFSLGKPALIVDLSMGRGKLSFDPQFRFSLEGKPWSFIFWWRYKIVEDNRFRLHVGAHPAYMFVNSAYSDNGETEEILEARRYVAAEISPNIIITEKISFKPYYLIGHGFDKGVRNSHYVAMRGSISNIGIAKNIEAAISPQVFFLKMDGLHGYYLASGFSLTHSCFPVLLGATINRKINSEIPSDDFLWNLSLAYKFGNTYTRQ